MVLELLAVQNVDSLSVLSHTVSFVCPQVVYTLSMAKQEMYSQQVN